MSKTTQFNESNNSGRGWTKTIILFIVITIAAEVCAVFVENLWISQLSEEQLLRLEANPGYKAKKEYAPAIFRFVKQFFD